MLHRLSGEPAIGFPGGTYTGLFYVADVEATGPATDDGPGLLRSPPNTLAANVDAYVDYLDASGAWVGRGQAIPATAVYVRRWSVQPHASDPDNVLVLEVVVGRRGSTGSQLADSIHLVSLEARK